MVQPLRSSSGASRVTEPDIWSVSVCLGRQVQVEFVMSGVRGLPTQSSCETGGLRSLIAGFATYVHL